jgi:hypothetical protein
MFAMKTVQTFKMFRLKIVQIRKIQINVQTRNMFKHKIVQIKKCLNSKTVQIKKTTNLKKCSKIKKD